MDIVDPASALLSNFEVLQLVSEASEQLKGAATTRVDTESSSENLNTITYELKKYLSQTPAATQSEAVVIEFLKAIQKYPLTRFEKLQLLNFRPGSEVLFLRLVEEGEERFAPDVISEILELIERILPQPPVGSDDVDTDAMDTMSNGMAHATSDTNGHRLREDDAGSHDGEDDELVNEKDAVDSEGEDDG
eukprot:m.197994 g.197994  ORF g.197994 m.197994 type:complete len:191 (+) comp20299_c0_seq1:347-919(+)